MTLLLQSRCICDFGLMRCAHVWQVWDGAESGRCLRVYTCHSGAVRDACWTPCGRHFLTGSFDNKAVITDVETGEQQHFFSVGLMNTMSHNKPHQGTLHQNIFGVPFYIFTKIQRKLHSTFYSIKILFEMLSNIHFSPRVLLVC